MTKKKVLKFKHQWSNFLPTMVSQTGNQLKNVLAMFMAMFGAMFEAMFRLSLRPIFGVDVRLTFRGNGLGKILGDIWGYVLARFYQ